MNEFERKYYEADAFWDNGAITDSGNRKRIEYTASIIPDDCSSLVDVGCGNGVFLRHLSEIRPKLKLLGIDRSISALKHVNCDKLTGEITDIPLDDRSYDCVVCSQVLEHIPIPIYKKSISELARVSARYLVISVPFCEDLESAFTQCPSCLSSFNRDLHLRSYSAETMENLVSEFGFEHVHSMNLVKSRHLVGMDFINRIRRSPESRKFESPICPICGFENHSFGGGQAKEKIGASQERRKSLVKDMVRRIWPTKQVNGYWIVSLYTRIAAKRVL